MALYLQKKDKLGVITQAYLYKWTHIPTRKWYVGSRTAIGCHIEDGYICSSNDVYPMIVYNKSEWERTILCIGNPGDIVKLEAAYLESLDAKNDPMSFNMHNGDGKFTTTGRKESAESKHRRIQKLKGKKKPEGFGNTIASIRTGMKFDDEWCKNIGKASLGRIQSSDARKKNSQKNSGKNNPSFVGYYVSPMGIIFESSRKAAAEFDVTRQTIVNWAKNNKNGWSFQAKEISL
jgi:hypothetical protein